MREFPPRLAHQPIFYPVTNAEYARQIARDWNTHDEKSGFAGFVTAFSIDSISDSDIGRQEQEAFLDNLNKVWDFNHIEVPLPARP
jgi:hypothetical protein